MKWLRGLVAVLVTVTVPVFAVCSVSAGVNDFTVTNFISDQTLTRDDKQGTLRIQDDITVQFTDNNHGIIRAIPSSYKGNSLKFHLNAITSRTGAPTDVDQSSANGNIELKIGSASRTVTGSQQYTIDYTLQNVITFYGDHDELYWDVNGDDWDQSFGAVTVNLHIPNDLKLSGQAPACFDGAYGTDYQTCTIEPNDTGLSARTANLGPHQTLTYVTGFDTGYFAPMTLFEKMQDRFALVLGLGIIPFVTLLLCMRWWLRSGRDPKGRGVIVPQYAAYPGISPLEAGAITDFKVDNRDITATVVDLARRGYIRIHEERKDRLILKDKISYSLELTNLEYVSLSAHEVQLLNALFKEKTLHATTDLGTPNAALQKTALSLRKSVVKQLAKSGYFTQDPSNFTAKSGAIVAVIFIGIYVVTLTASLNIWPIVVGTILSAVIYFIFVSVMPARTAKGVAAKEYLLGLKLYMDTAEKDRITKLESPNAPYAAGAGQPTRTIELFEKLLPYAIVMGVEKEWAKQFESLYKESPSWYSSTSPNFSSIYFASALGSSFTPAVNTAFSSPSSSGSSGFSGGFSGGGGGGGGGGGW